MTRFRYGQLLSWRVSQRQLLLEIFWKMQKPSCAAHTVRKLAGQTISYFRGYSLFDVLS